MLCVICDDLAQERNRLINLLDRFGESHSVKVQTVQFDCAEALLESYEDIKNADMIFIDIYMAEMNGMTAAKLAEEKDVTVAQIALAWLLSGPINTLPIISASDPARLQENAKAAEIQLTLSECAYLNLEIGTY